MEDIVFENVVDDIITGTTGNLWLLDTDSVYGYDTVVFDAGGDNNYTGAYDWGAAVLPNGEIAVGYN